MSCRVLGRGAEQTFIAKLSEAAEALECDHLRGAYIATPKNGMVQDLYARFNFQRVGQTNEWTIEIDKVAHPPEHIDATLRLPVLAFK
jgi:predicted enzyme involved in methoxymalonyl-ACP biosynthesis